MTGYISSPGTPNPLSVVSIDQFVDLGYPVVDNTGADPYALNTVSAAAPSGPPVQLVNDVWRGPLYRIEGDGTMTLVRPDRR
jgi:hypothetical protein